LYNKLLYIGPGLGVGAAVLIVLILLLIVFSFGYRLWYSLFKAPKPLREALESSMSATSFSWEFYATVFTALLIITTFNPSWLGVESSGKYNTALHSVPTWVSIVLGSIIVGSLLLILRSKRKAKASFLAKEVSQKTFPGFTFTPLNTLLVCAIIIRATVLAFNQPLADAIAVLSGNTVIAYGFAAMSGVMLGQAILWMKNLFFETATASVSLLNVFFTPSEELSKIAAINAASSRTTKVLAQLIGSLVVIAITVFSLGWQLPGWLLGEGFSNNWALIIVSIGSVVPFFFTKSNGSAYSDLSQLFHRLVLDNYFLGKKLLELQVKGVNAQENARHVYTRVLVTGLARAGTTALTKSLAERGSFASLDYRNMPLLLAPRIWSKIYRPKVTEDKERAHGDGVMVGLASVEALEEYFFKVLKNDVYIKEDGVYEHELSSEENALYRRYQNSIAGSRIYLAKNNNAILRLPSLVEHNTDLAVFILVRRPLQHACSLMTQHQQFSAKQEGDPFIKEYMDWLGHHEFGLGQRPFILGGKGHHDGNTTDINYWLERWVNYYENIPQSAQITVLSYESFLTNPKETLTRIEAVLDAPIDCSSLYRFKKTPRQVQGADHELLRHAEALYARLIG
tara:strand:+ start:689 stop:2563 length:1875 start_codon:yes stop_codon:yes gene_type:complete